MNKIEENYPQTLRLDRQLKEKYLEKLIAKNSGTCFAGHNLTDIWLIAAAMGFANNSKIPTTKGKDGAVDVRVYDMLTTNQKILVRAITLAEAKYDYDKVFDGKFVFKTIEEYANGGMKILHDAVYAGLDLSILDDMDQLLKKRK